MWKLADELGLARLVFVNMLDRERADFFRTLDAAPVAALRPLRRRAHPDRRGARARGHRRRPPHVRVHEPRGRQGGRARADPGRRWRRSRGVPGEAPRRRRRDGRGAHGALPRGRELDAHEVAAALKAAVTSGDVFPVACGVATKNLGTHALLDLLVEGVPSPAKKGVADRRRRRRHRRVRLQDRRRPVRRHASTSSACSRARSPPTRRSSTSAGRARSASGTLLELQGKEHKPALDFGEGDIGAVAKLKERRPATCSPTRRSTIEVPDFGFPEPVMSFAITPKSKGDEEKVATAIRRLAEEDPTLRLRRDQQTGEEILVGHEPDARRGRARAREAPLRCRHRAAPAARPVPRDDPPRGARARPLQEADGRPRPVRRLPHRRRAARRATSATSSSTRSSAASSRRASGRRSTRGSRRRCTTASSPARPCRACASSSSTARTTPSTRRRWRSRSPARWRGRTRT